MDSKQFKEMAQEYLKENAIVIYNDVNFRDRVSGLMASFAKFCCQEIKNPGRYMDAKQAKAIRGILKGMPEGQGYHYHRIAMYTQTTESLVKSVIYRQRRVTKVSKPIVEYALEYADRMAQRQLNLIK